jgi:hypothetical protein
MKNIRISVMSFFNKIKSLFSSFGDAMRCAWQLAIRTAIVSGYGKEITTDGLIKFYEADKGWRSCYINNIILSK